MNTDEERELKARVATLEEDVRRIQRLAHIGTWYVDKAHDVIQWSDPMYDIFGMHNCDGIQLRDIQNMVHPEDWDDVVLAAKSAWNDSAHFTIEYRILRPSGEIRFLRTEAEIFKDEWRIFGVTKDVSDEKAVALELEDSVHRYDSLFEYFPDFIYHTDVEGKWCRVNQAIVNHFGYSPEQLAEMTALNVTVPEDEHLIYQSRRNVLQGIPDQKVVTVTAADGTRMNIDVTVIPEYVRGAIAGTCVIGRDITEHIQAQQEIHRLAFYDHVTKLPNRQFLHDRLTNLLEASTPFTLLFIDLDGFKAVNDSLGHHKGDELLRQVGGRLQSVVGDTESVVRMGGDEFIVILCSTYDEGLIGKTVRSIFDVLSKPILMDTFPVHVTCSVGVSMYPQHGRDASTLLKNADAAMYKAKSIGTNQCSFYSAELTEHAFERLGRMSEM